MIERDQTEQPDFFGAASGAKQQGERNGDIPIWLPTHVRFPGVAHPLPVTYRVVSLWSVLTSHVPSAVMPRAARYPARVQHREYAGWSGERNRRQVLEAAERLEPALLLDLSEAASIGPPLVCAWEDTSAAEREVVLITVAGNQRAMALQLAAESFRPRFQHYRRALQARATLFGLQPDNIAEDSVLVREFGEDDLTRWYAEAHPYEDQRSETGETPASVNRLSALAWMNRLSDAPVSKARDSATTAYTLACDVQAIEGDDEATRREANAYPRRTPLRVARLLTTGTESSVSGIDQTFSQLLRRRPQQALQLHAAMRDHRTVAPTDDALMLQPRAGQFAELTPYAVATLSTALGLVVLRDSRALNASRYLRAVDPSLPRLLQLWWDREWDIGRIIGAALAVIAEVLRNDRRANATATSRVKWRHIERLLHQTSLLSPRTAVMSSGTPGGEQPPMLDVWSTANVEILTARPLDEEEREKVRYFLKFLLSKKGTLVVNGAIARYVDIASQHIRWRGDERAQQISLEFTTGARPTLASIPVTARDAFMHCFAAEFRNTRTRSRREAPRRLEAIIAGELPDVAAAARGLLHTASTAPDQLAAPRRVLTRGAKPVVADIHICLALELAARCAVGPRAFDTDRRLTSLYREAMRTLADMVSEPKREGTIEAPAERRFKGGDTPSGQLCLHRRKQWQRELERLTKPSTELDEDQQQAFAPRAQFLRAAIERYAVSRARPRGSASSNNP